MILENNMQPSPLTDRRRCLECGAPSREGLNCWEQLGLLTSLESRDPELRAQHFLTVASYNLQHPAQFMDEALAGLRELFIAYLDEGMRVEEIRRRVAKVADGSYRVLKKKADQSPVPRQWSMTIADVYVPDHEQSVAARVREWAAAIRKEL